MTAVENQQGGVFFLHGYGGTGKTFMWRTLSSALRSKCKIVLTVASSGIASLLLPGGRTAHSKFKIHVPTEQNSTCNIEYDSHHAELLQQTQLIIWDEAPMAHKYCFEALDKTMKDIMTKHNNSNEIFGGKVVIFGGDFRQILPVVPKGKLGEGTLNEPNDGVVEIKIPQEFLIMEFDDPILGIINNTFPNLMDNYMDYDYLSSRAILASTIEVVDKINSVVLGLLPGEEVEYLSADSLDRSEITEGNFFEVITPEFLNSLHTSGLPNHKIKVKIGSPIMLMRNIDQIHGLCNGTRLIVTHLGQHVMVATIMYGKHRGRSVYIHRMDMSPSQSPWPFKMTRRQFPIIVSYAMTINKSQGQSLDQVGL
ncbi:ATP-dependent DNA helicase PIF1 [Trifolium repens]|nr:ATP-dependent DNA helicase PIF1 [Trifolium repens]